MADPAHLETKTLPPLIGRARAVLALMAATLALSLVLPAYVDDILYLISDSRAGYDGWQSITAYPQCGPAFVTAIPLVLLPGRALAWGLHTLIDDLSMLRFISLLLLLGWGAYTAWFLKRCVFPAQPWLYIWAGIAALTGLGMLPLAMTLGRPETAILFAVTFYVSVPFIVYRYPAPSLGIILSMAVLFLLVTSWFLDAHAKTLLYIPLILVSSAYLCRWHKAAGAGLMALAAGMCCQAALYVQQRLDCPDSPLMRNFIDNTRLPPSLFFRDQAQFLKQLFLNLAGNATYSWEMTLPNFAFAGAVPRDFSNGYSLSLLVVAAAIALIILRTVMGTLAGSVLAARCAMASRSLYLLPVLACLLAAFFAQCAVQTEKVFYNFSLPWITLLLSGITAMACLSRLSPNWSAYEARLAHAFRWLLAVSALSQCAALITYIPATWIMFQGEALNGFVPASPLASIGQLHYAETKEHVLGAARLCHIAPDASSRRVAVNQFTYLPLKHTSQPLQAGFRLFEEYDDAPKLFAFLRKWESSGLVTSCAALPASLRHLAKEYQGICCISRDQIGAR